MGPHLANRAFSRILGVLALVLALSGAVPVLGQTSAHAGPCDGGRTCDQRVTKPQQDLPQGSRLEQGMAGTIAGPAWARNTLSWGLRNDTPYRISVRYFSKSRKWVWPSNGSVYQLNDGLRRWATLSCIQGEKICYGAWYSGHPNAGYWGVGPWGNRGCAACCAICNGGSIRINLTP